MIKPIEKPFKDLVLSDNKKDNILELHQNGAYRAVDCRLVINMTNGGVAPTFKEDDILNYVKSVGIRINGRIFKRDLPLRFKYHVDSHMKGTKPYKLDPSTTINATYDAIVDFSFDFAESVLNRSDTSALLQTKNLTNLELVVSTGAVADIASANAPTINSRKIEVSTRYYQGTVNSGGAEVDINDNTKVTMTDIKESTSIHDLLANMTQFDKVAQDIDLIVGSAILNHALMVTDNGVRSNDRVTDIKFKRAKPIDDDITEVVWKNYNEKSKAEYALENQIVGVAYFDWQEFYADRFGLQTSSKSSELLKLLTNGIVATEDKIEVYTRYV